MTSVTSLMERAHQLHDEIQRMKEDGWYLCMRHHILKDRVSEERNRELLEEIDRLHMRLMEKKDEYACIQ